MIEMLVVARETTVNFDNVLFMDVENETLNFDCGDYYYDIVLDSSEKAHQARRLIESAYAHGEKICKI